MIRVRCFHIERIRNARFACAKEVRDFSFGTERVRGGPFVHIRISAVAMPVDELRSWLLLRRSGSNPSCGARNTLQPGSQRLPGGLSRFALGCCRYFGRVARLRWWTRARRRSQGCAKRTSKRLDLDGVSVSTINEGLAISQTLVASGQFEQRRGKDDLSGNAVAEGWHRLGLCLPLHVLVSMSNWATGTRTLTIALDIRG